MDPILQGLSGNLLITQGFASAVLDASPAVTGVQATGQVGTITVQVPLVRLGGDSAGPTNRKSARVVYARYQINASPGVSGVAAQGQVGDIFPDTASVWPESAFPFVRGVTGRAAVGQMTVRISVDASPRVRPSRRSHVEEDELLLMLV